MPGAWLRRANAAEKHGGAGLLPGQVSVHLTAGRGKLAANFLLQRFRDVQVIAMTRTKASFTAGEAAGSRLQSISLRG